MLLSSQKRSRNTISKNAFYFHPIKLRPIQTFLLFWGHIQRNPKFPSRRLVMNSDPSHFYLVSTPSGTPKTTQHKAEPSKKNSKLDPYSELITVLLTKGSSFQTISEILKTQFELKTSPGNIHSFIQTRRRRALREYTYNALQALHCLYLFTTNSKPTYDQLIEDLLKPDAISNLYEPLYQHVQQSIKAGDISYIDRKKYEACFASIALHWFNIPKEIKDAIINTLQTNTPNNVRYFLNNHISKPERAKPEFFQIP